MANRLKDQTSPYLLQHANNPVDWYPWGEEALTRAREENKLILVSIGYSACHWCHVMEHESFENQEVADVMNEHFVNIKVDREVRPDIDQIYMNAVQLMTGSGGWPLNCICLPDQRPIYGGTYFRRPDWIGLLNNLAEFWRDKPGEAVEYAVRLTEGIAKSEMLLPSKVIRDFSFGDVRDIYEPWKRTFDLIEGGYNRAPKFPLPNNWQFILRYAHLSDDNSAHVALNITLQKMAFGGIYDHIGGGFARYSVDDKWHVPHFEKMLYDNAQLVSLYSEAFQLTRNPLYRDVVSQTLEFINREMTSPEGGFYSALDADSEGVEGKFYTFSKAEIDRILGEDAALFNLYYSVSDAGNWEEENTNVLMRRDEDDEIASQLAIDVTELKERIAAARERLFQARSARVRPGLDDKMLTSWNAMMIRGFTDAYRAFGKASYLEAALKNAGFLFSKRFTAGRLQRLEMTEAFLDDYAFLIDACVSLYEVTFEETWLMRARKLTDAVIDYFYDESNGLFFYTSSESEQLIARKQEIVDNVIPSSNSVMALNLFRLGGFFEDENYLDLANRMISTVQPYIKKYPTAYSNWSNLLLLRVFGQYEIAVTGPGWQEHVRELETTFIPNKILLGGTSGSLPLLADKPLDQSKIYVCRNRTCSLPVSDVSEAIKQIDKPGSNPL